MPVNAEILLFAFILTKSIIVLGNDDHTGHSSKAKIKDYMYHVEVDDYDVIEFIKTKGLFNSSVKDVAIIAAVKKSSEISNGDGAMFQFSFTTVPFILLIVYLGYFKYDSHSFS